MIVVHRNVKKSKEKIESLESDIASIEEKTQGLYAEITKLDEEAKEALTEQKAAEVCLHSCQGIQ